MIPPGSSILPTILKKLNGFLALFSSACWKAGKVKIIKQNLILPILLLVSVAYGCANMHQVKYLVNVDSISVSSAIERKNYVLLPGNIDTTISDLQFKEYAAYVNRALISRGFVPADRIEDADMVIFLVYGIGNPQEHQYAYSLPVWGQTGVSSSSTSGTFTTFGNYGTFSGTTTYSPTYGITGYTSHVGSYATYFRFLVLDAFDLAEYKQNKKEIELWKTTITSTGVSGDLRRVFPYMISASEPYLGINTGQQLKVILDEGDPRVQEIKGQNMNNQK